MKADSTLVEGAYRAAMAMVPNDYSSYYKTIQEAQTRAMTGLAKGLSGAFEKFTTSLAEVRAKKKKITDKQSSKFSDAADKVLKKLASYNKNESLNEQMYGKYYDKIQDLKDEFEVNNLSGADDSPESEKARHKLFAQLDGYKNEVIGIRSDFLKLGEFDKEKQINYTASGAKNLAIMSEILDQDGDYSNVDMQWDDKGGKFVVDMSHDVEGIENNLYGEPNDEGKYVVSMRFGDMMKKIVIKDPAVEADINEIISDQYKNGQEKDGLNFDFSLTKDKIRDMIKDENVFMDLANRRLQGHKLSWADSLESHPAISVMAYENIGIDASSIDTNNDGVISPKEAQQLDATNQEAVIDALTNRDNEFFDLETSKLELSNYYALMAEDKFSAGRKSKGLNSSGSIIPPPEETPPPTEINFSDITDEQIVETGGDPITIRFGENRNIQYGVGVGTTQSIRVKNLYDTITSGEFEDYTSELKTVEDFDNLIKKIKDDPNFAGKLTKHINENYKTKEGEKRGLSAYNIHKYFEEMKSMLEVNSLDPDYVG